MTETRNNPKQRTAFAMPAYRRIGDDLRARVGARHWMPGAMLPSRKDLAAEYGVSVPTVERAVADLLSEGALRADHRGTFVAGRSRETDPRPMREAATATVGIVAGMLPSPDGRGTTSPWAEVVVKSLETSLARTGTATRFFNLNRPDGTEVTAAQGIDALLAEGVDAIALVLAWPEQMSAAASVSKRVPLLLVSGYRHSHPGLSVCFDGQDAGYQAAHHLLERGCPDLLFFAPYTADWVGSRLAGLRQAAQMAGLPASSVSVSVPPEPLEQVMREQPNHWDAGYAAARTLLRDGLPARGVVAANDYAALGFRQAAEEAGLTAGRDYALVGFDDHPHAREAGLTSLHPPLEGAGQEAARLLLSALSGQTSPMQVCLHFHLVPRTSSRGPFSPVRLDTASALVQTCLIPPQERVISHDTAVLSAF